MQHLEVSCAVRRLFKSLGFEGLLISYCCVPVTIAKRSQTFTVSYSSNSGFVGSYPTRSLDVCFYTVFCLSCVDIGLAMG